MLTRVIKQIRPSLALLVITALLMGAPVQASPQTASAGRIAAAPVAAPLAAAVTLNLCAEASTSTSDGHLTMPDTTVIPIWGFSPAGNTGDCTDNSAIPSLPGPTLVVNEGDVVTVNLYNQLSENVSIAFHGQGLPADTVGAPPAGMTTYTFTASNPGTFLYEAGLTSNGAKQVAMGLYGALIVQPATPATTYTNETMLVLSEIDPALNASPATFDMLNYAPKYWLINGEAHPDTDLIQAPAGQTMLARYLNAGLDEHSPALLGLDQTVIAKDGHARPAFRAVAETIAAGQTMDTLIAVPAALGARYPLYDGNQHVDNNGATMGGMVTFIEAAAASNLPPTASISAPADLSSFVAGTSVTFTGMGSDTEDGDVTASLAWTSDLDGPIGTSGSFSTSTLSVGTHTITALATDSGTLTGSAAITVTITAAPTNTPPTASISAPADLSSFVAGTSVTFTGTGSDIEDGDVTASLVWTSNLDGPIGTGGSFSTSTLSVGTHTITAVATDSGTLTGSAAITVTITTPPPTTMHIGAMANASVNDPPGGFFDVLWTARVTITIHDASHTPVGAGITVTGAWSGPGAGIPIGDLTCTTNASGQCTVERIRGEGTGSATFTVSGVSGGSLTYTLGDNDAGPALLVPNPPGT